MMSLFEQVLLHEAVPRKASQLGLSPEDPPDLTNFDPNKAPEQQDQNNQQQNTDPADMNPPQDVQPDAGAPQDAPPEGGDPNAAPDDPNAMGGEDPNAQDPNDPNAMPQGPDGMDQAPGAELDQADQELFKDLKPEQIEVRDRELKERFQDLYTIITETLEKLNKVTKTSYDARMLELSLKQLINLKDLVLVAVTRNFKAKTYLENKIELNKLVTVFNQITNTIGTIYEARVKRTLKYDKQHVSNLGSSNFENIDFTQDLGF